MSDDLNRAAPAAAQLDADLPPPAISTGGCFPNFADAAQEPYYTADQVRKVVAQYAERIRLLEREKAERKQVGSIGDYTQFHVLLNAVCDASQELDEAEGHAVFAAADKLEKAKDALIAYIDGRTASTAPPERTKAQFLAAERAGVSFSTQQKCWNAWFGAAAPSPLSGTEEAKCPE